MKRAVGAVAAGTGHLIRFLALSLPALLRALAFASIVTGLAMFDSRVALIVGGSLLLVLLWPRPNGAA